MHNFDSLCFIKGITSIVKAAAFLIYLQVLNIKFQEEKKSNVKENFQGSVKPKGEGSLCWLFFSPGLHHLCSAMLLCLSVIIFKLPLSCADVIFSVLFFMFFLFPPKEESNYYASHACWLNSVRCSIRHQFSGSFSLVSLLSTPSLRSC